MTIVFPNYGFEFSLAKPGESGFQRRFLNIFEFAFLFFQALFKRRVNNKSMLDESSLLHIFYYILYTIIPSLTRRFEMMVTATLKKNFGHPMLKQKDDSCSQEDQDSHSTCTFLCHGKLMLRISNIFLHLVEITFYQK